MKQFISEYNNRIAIHRFILTLAILVLLSMVGIQVVLAKSYTFKPLGFQNTACSGWERVTDPNAQQVTFSGAVDASEAVIGEFWYQYNSRWSRLGHLIGSTYQFTLTNPEVGSYQLCWTHITQGNKQTTGTLTTIVNDIGETDSESDHDEVIEATENGSKVAESNQEEVTMLIDSDCDCSVNELTDQEREDLLAEIDRDIMKNIANSSTVEDAESIYRSLPSEVKSLPLIKNAYLAKIKGEQYELEDIKADVNYRMFAVRCIDKWGKRAVASLYLVNAGGTHVTGRLTGKAATAVVTNSSVVAGSATTSELGLLSRQALAEVSGSTVQSVVVYYFASQAGEKTADGINWCVRDNNDLFNVGVNNGQLLDPSQFGDTTARLFGVGFDNCRSVMTKSVTKGTFLDVPPTATDNAVATARGWVRWECINAVKESVDEQNNGTDILDWMFEDWSYDPVEDE